MYYSVKIFSSQNILKKFVKNREKTVVLTPNFLKCIKMSKNDQFSSIFFLAVYIYI